MATDSDLELKLRIDAENAEAKKALGEVETAVDRLESTAESSEIDLKADGTQAKTEIAEVEADAKRLEQQSPDVKVTAETRAAEEDLEKLNEKLKDTDEQAEKAEQSTGGLNESLKNLALAAAGAIAIGELGGSFVDANVTAGRLRASLETVTGSTEAASAAWEELLKFAAETPFTLDQSVEGFIKLKALGLDPSIENLRSFGNTASSMGKSMMDFVEAVADATTGEFERLKEFGIKAAQQGDTVALTFQGTTKVIKKSADEIQQYLVDIGNNQFAGAMERQMATLGGAISNLQDSFMQLMVNIGDSGATQALSTVLVTLAGNLDLVAKAAVAVGFGAMASQAKAAATAIGAYAAQAATAGAASANFASKLHLATGALTALVGYEIGSWLRETTVEMGKAAEAGTALAVAYDLLATSEEKAAAAAEETSSRRDAALRKVEQSTGLVIGSMAELNDLADKGILVFNEAAGTWERTGVAMETAALSVDKFDAALLDTQATVLALNKSLDAQTAALTAQAKASTTIAQLTGDETAARQALAESVRQEAAAAEAKATLDATQAALLQARVENLQREKEERLALVDAKREETQASQEEVAQAQAALEVAQRRLDAISQENDSRALLDNTLAGQIATAEREVEQAGKQVQAAEARDAALSSEIASRKQQAQAIDDTLSSVEQELDATQRAAAASRAIADAKAAEAAATSALTETIGDQSAALAPILQEYTAYRQELREIETASEAAARAQGELADAEADAASAHEALRQAVESGSDEIARYANAARAADDRVSQLKGTIEAGEQAQSQAQTTTGKLAAAHEKLKDAVEDAAAASDRSQQTLESEYDLSTELANGKLTELRARQELAEAQGDEYASKQLGVEIQEAEIALIEAEIAFRRSKAALLQQEADQRQAAADATQQNNAELQAEIDLLRTEAALLEAQANSQSSALEIRKQITAATQAGGVAAKENAATTQEQGQAAEEAAAANDDLATSVSGARDAAVAMQEMMADAVADIREWSDEAANLADSIFHSGGSFKEAIDAFSSLGQLDLTSLIDPGARDQLVADLADIEASMASTKAELAELEQAAVDDFEFFDEFYQVLVAAKEFELELAKTTVTMQRAKIAAYDLGEDLGNITDEFELGRTSLPEYITQLEALESQYRTLSEEDLADLRAALADAREQTAEIDLEHLESQFQAGTISAETLKSGIEGLIDEYSRFEDVDLSGLRDALDEARGAVVEMEATNLAAAFDEGELSIQDFEAAVQSALVANQDLSDERLAPLRDAIQGARSDMADFAEEAADGLRTLQSEWAELSGQQVQATILEHELERLDLERQITQAKSEGNAEALDSLNAQVELLSQIQAKELEIAAQAEADQALVNAQARTEEAERQAGLTQEQRALELEIADIQRNMTAAAANGNQSELDSLAEQLVSLNNQLDVVNDRVDSEKEITSERESANQAGKATEDELYNSAQKRYDTEQAITNEINNRSQTIPSSSNSSTSSSGKVSKTVKVILSAGNESVDLYNDEEFVDAVLRVLENAKKAT